VENSLTFFPTLDQKITLVLGNVGTLAHESKLEFWRERAGDCVSVNHLLRWVFLEVLFDALCERLYTVRVHSSVLV